MNIINATGKFRQEDVVRMQMLLAAVMADSTRDVGLILRETAASFARSAWERTPKSKKLATVKVKAGSYPPHKGKGVYVWTWMKRASGGAERLPVPMAVALRDGWTKSGGKRPQFHRAEYQGNRQVIRNRGFARSGWLGVLNKLGIQQGADEDTAPDASTGKTIFNMVADNKDAQTLTISQHTAPAVYLNQQRDIMGRSLAVTNQNLQRQLATHARQIKQRWER
jgi:hypothetical protein